MNTERNVAVSGELAWFKSSYSGSDGGDCVEVAVGAGRVHVRDSKTDRSPTLSVPTGPWAAFVTYAAERTR
ncbi:MAG: DUF397 domain-containing protein [Streptomyces sp.]|uniref:DUF397 domain-containing protein n=1 Tax=Streptomyces sp. TaxID=1931 RepID=UPI003D6C12B9